MTEAPDRNVERPARRGPGSYDRRLSPLERRNAQRSALVDAAAHVFARDGFASASVASILEASGLSRGTFYRHFRDLREAFLAVQENGGDVLYARIEAAYRSENDLPERMSASVAAYLGTCKDYGDLSRVFHREALVGGREYAELRKRTMDRVHHLFRQGLAEALECGLIRRAPEETMIYAVIVAVEGVALRYLEEQREHEVLEALGPLVRLARRAFS